MNNKEYWNEVVLTAAYVNAYGGLLAFLLLLWQERFVWILPPMSMTGFVVLMLLDLEQHRKENQ